LVQKSHRKGFNLSIGLRYKGAEQSTASRRFLGPLKGRVSRDFQTPMFFFKSNKSEMLHCKCTKRPKNVKINFAR
jgi:hypothetical protein